MCIGVRAAHALQHINLLLVLIAGATLCTAARLRWDPTLYVALRAVMPFEYRLMAGALPAAGFALLVMAHLAIVASQPPRPRGALLYTYAGLMVGGIALEIALGGWVYSRIVTLLNSPEAQEMEEILATKDYLQPLLQHLSRWHSIPDHISALIDEAEEDAPWNGYVAAAVGISLLLLQLLGVVFAILAARVPNTSKAKRYAHTNGGLSASRVSIVDSIRYGGRVAAQHCKLVIVWLSLDRSSLSSRSRSRSNVAPQTPASVRSFRSTGSRSEEWAPLKAKYKNGMLVPV